MKDGDRLSLEQIQAFLKGSEDVGFQASGQRELYEWTERTLCAQEYVGLSGSGKRLVRQYIAKMTGLSRAQVARLISQYAASGTIRSRRGKGRRFAAHYSAADIALLAQVDEAHDTLSGPCDAENPLPGVLRIRRGELRTTGEYFGSAHLQSA